MCQTSSPSPPPVIMTSEEQVRVLSLRVAAAPANSEEFRVAMDELRAALKASATSGHEKVAALKQRAVPQSGDEWHTS
jgi:hypothetical protein